MAGTRNRTCRLLVLDSLFAALPTAAEICLTGTFTFVLHKMRERQIGLRCPRTETATHYVSFGMNSDLDVAMEKVLREMIDFLCVKTGWSRVQAYKTCSLSLVEQKRS